MVHFQNKWGMKGMIPWERASWSGFRTGVAGEGDLRWWQPRERESREEEIKERKKKGSDG
jgi:hypothetical protein